MAPGWQPCVLAAQASLTVWRWPGSPGSTRCGLHPAGKTWGQGTHSSWAASHCPPALLQLTTPSTAGDTTAYTSATTAWSAGEHISDVLIHNIVDILK